MKRELSILESISSEFIVVNYLTESISGKNVGMLDDYRNSFNSLVKNKDWSIDKLLFVVGK
jgi:hypothetical protein